MRFACHGMQQFWLNVSVTSSLVCNGCLSSEGFDNDLRVLGMDPRVLVRNGLKCLRNLSLISSTYIRKQAFPKLPQCCGHADPEHHLFSFSVFRNKSIYPPQKEALFLHGFGIIMSVISQMTDSLIFYRKSKYCWMLIFVKALENLTLYSPALTDLSGMLCISKQLRTELGSSLSLYFSALQRLYCKGRKIRPTSQSNLTCTKPLTTLISSPQFKYEWMLTHCLI